MLVKAICFRDVKPGDVVCQEEGKHRRVGGVSTGDIYTELFLQEGGILQGRPNQYIGLVHRPWPEGKTEKNMLWAVVIAMKNSTRKTSWNVVVPLFSKVREAVEAYELGKPIGTRKQDLDSINCSEEQREHIHQEGFW